MPLLIINTYVSLMYELEKMERYLRVNLLGPGPRLMEKEFTRPQSHKVEKHCSRQCDLQYLPVSSLFFKTSSSSLFLLPFGFLALTSFLQ